MPPWQAAAKKPDSGVQCQQGGGDEPTKEQPWTGKLPKAVTFQQSNTNDLTAEAVVKEKPSPAGSSRYINMASINAFVRMHYIYFELNFVPLAMSVHV